MLRVECFAHKGKTKEKEREKCDFVFFCFWFPHPQPQPLLKLFCRPPPPSPSFLLFFDSGRGGFRQARERTETFFVCAFFARFFSPNLAGGSGGATVFGSDSGKQQNDMKRKRQRQKKLRYVRPGTASSCVYLSSSFQQSSSVCVFKNKKTPSTSRVCLLFCLELLSFASSLLCTSLHFLCSAQLCLLCSALLSRRLELIFSLPRFTLPCIRVV